MEHSDKYYKSRAFGVTFEVDLTTDRRPFGAVSLLLLLLQLLLLSDYATRHLLYFRDTGSHVCTSHYTTHVLLLNTYNSVKWSQVTMIIHFNINLHINLSKLNGQTILFDPLMGLNQVLPLGVRVDLEVIGNERVLHRNLTMQTNDSY